MKQIKHLMTALCLAAAAGLFVPVPVVMAADENEVLASDIPAYPPGALISNDTRIIMPDETSLRILITTSGSTKTLQGPYEGTIPDYREERTWWERITGRSKETDAPIGGVRGMTPKTD